MFENVGIASESGDMDFYFLPPEFTEPDCFFPSTIGTFTGMPSFLILKIFRICWKDRNKENKNMTLKS